MNHVRVRVEHTVTLRGEEALRFVAERWAESPVLRGSSLWVKVARSCLTLYDPMGYTVHGILQTRTQEWAACPFPSGGIDPGSPAVRWILYQLSYLVYAFFSKAFNSISFPLNITLTASNRFWFMFTFIYSEYLLISFGTYRWFRCAISFPGTWKFPSFLSVIDSKFMSILVREYSLISVLLNWLHLLYLFSSPCPLIRVLTAVIMTAPLRTSAWISCLGHSLTNSYYFCLVESCYSRSPSCLHRA